MKFVELKNSLVEGVQPIYLVEGEDAFLRETALRLIKQKALSSPDINLTNLLGQDIEKDFELFLTATESYPFMSDKRYVVVRDFYPTATTLKNKVLKRIFENPCETTVVVIVNDKKCEPLKKLSNVTFVDCQKADVKVITSFIINKTKSKGVIISQTAIDKLIDFCSLDLTRINGELDKLLAFAINDLQITPELVEEMVSKDSEFEIYELTEAIAKLNREKAFEILSELTRKNQDKQRLFISVYYHFRRLLHARISKCTLAELAENLQVKEFVAKKAREQAQRFSAKRLKAICDKLSYYDVAFKSGELSVDTALTNSVLYSTLTE